MFLDILPAELIDEILSNLRPNTLTKLARVSKAYRDFAESRLWRSIELHRKDLHEDRFRLPTHKRARRSFLSDERRCPDARHFWIGTDTDYDRRNAKFGTMVRTLYRSAGKSKSWTRLAPFLQHLCLSITSRSPPTVWDMVLSLPKLRDVEIIGDWSIGDHAVGRVATLHPPKAKSIKFVRLRGYIPSAFVVEMCKASATSIVSLDLGVLEQPKEDIDDEDESELEDELEYPLFVAPRGILWFKKGHGIAFSCLTHIHLCKRGAFHDPPEIFEDDDLETHEDKAHEKLELRLWASLLTSVRDTVTEIILEQRPINLDYLLQNESGVSPRDLTSFLPETHPFNTQFYQEVVKAAFDDGGTWIKLKKLTFRGIYLSGATGDKDETLEKFATRVLPGVLVEEVPGNYMFFDTGTGKIDNSYSVDGLMPHVCPENHCHDYDWKLDSYRMSGP